MLPISSSFLDWFTLLFSHHPVPPSSPLFCPLSPFSTTTPAPGELTSRSQLIHHRAAEGSGFPTSTPATHSTRAALQEAMQQPVPAEHIAYKSWSQKYHGMSHPLWHSLSQIKGTKVPFTYRASSSCLTATRLQQQLPGYHCAPGSLAVWKY